MTVTRGQWHEMGFNMVWSIMDSAEQKRVNMIPYDPKKEEEFWKEWESVPCNLSAPEGLADGGYKVAVSYPKNSPAVGVVEILDGKFVPVPTDRAVFKAVCASYGISVEEGLKKGIHHVFIESFKWDEERNILIVGLGS